MLSESRWGFNLSAWAEVQFGVRVNLGWWLKIIHLPTGFDFLQFKSHPERGPLAKLWEKSDISVVFLSNFSTDGQAQSNLVLVLQNLENFILIIGLDADACVLHNDVNLLLGSIIGDLNVDWSLGGVGDSILDQVD